MKTNHTQSSLNLQPVVDRYLEDVIIAGLAIRYTELGSRAFARRAYRIESEMTAIASEIGNHTRLPEHQVERFLVALAKARRPSVELSLPSVAGPEVREIGSWSPGRLPIPAARKVAVLSDWSPKQNVEVAL